jgi:hypothetical protein
MVSRQAKDPCLCSPLRSCFEQSDEPVRRPEGDFAQMWWNDCHDGFELFCGVATRVDFGGLQIAVAEPTIPTECLASPARRSWRRCSTAAKRSMYGPLGPKRRRLSVVRAVKYLSNIVSSCLPGPPDWPGTTGGRHCVNGEWDPDESPESTAEYAKNREVSRSAGPPTPHYRICP